MLRGIIKKKGSKLNLFKKSGSKNSDEKEDESDEDIKNESVPDEDEEGEIEADEEDDDDAYYAAAAAAAAAADDDDDNDNDDEEEEEDDDDEEEEEEEDDDDDDEEEEEAQESNQDSEENEEDDVHQLLEDMDIPEFEASDGEEEGAKEEEEEEEKGDKITDEDLGKKSWELVDWKERMQREEVYSKRYHPSKKEKKELDEMASYLGLGSATGMFGMGLRASMAIGMGASNADNMQTLFYGNHSILLQEGPVQWQDKDCGLVFLTDGFVLTFANFNSYNPLEKRYETSQIWTDVEFCEKVNSTSFAIELKSGDRYEIEVAEGNLKKWLKALEKVLIEYFMHNGDSSLTSTLGWQVRFHKTFCWIWLILGARSSTDSFFGGCLV